MSDLGARIKELRLERGLSIEVAANDLEPRVTAKAWATWELGRAEPQVVNLRGLMSFFGVSADYLLSETSNRTPKTYEVSK